MTNAELIWWFVFCVVWGVVVTAVADVARWPKWVGIALALVSALALSQVLA